MTKSVKRMKNILEICEYHLFNYNEGKPIRKCDLHDYGFRMRERCFIKFLL